MSIFFTHLKSKCYVFPDQASPIQVSLLTAEGMMMLGMHHKNILPLIGLCTDDLHHPMLVYPYMNQGNLKKFLHRCMLAAEGHCRVSINVTCI